MSWHSSLFCDPPPPTMWTSTPLARQMFRGTRQGLAVSLGREAVQDATDDGGRSLRLRTAPPAPAARIRAGICPGRGTPDRRHPLPGRPWAAPPPRLEQLLPGPAGDSSACPGASAFLEQPEPADVAEVPDSPSTPPLVGEVGHPACWVRTGCRAPRPPSDQVPGRKCRRSAAWSRVRRPPPRRYRRSHGNHGSAPAATPSGLPLPGSSVPIVSPGWMTAGNRFVWQAQCLEEFCGPLPRDGVKKARWWKHSWPLYGVAP